MYEENGKIHIARLQNLAVNKIQNYRNKWIQFVW